MSKPVQGEALFGKVTGNITPTFLQFLQSNVSAFERLIIFKIKTLDKFPDEANIDNR